MIKLEFKIWPSLLLLKLQAKLEVLLLLNLFKVVDPDQQAQRSYGLGQFVLLLL